MKYVFFGTPDFAARVLGKLVEGGFVPTALVANPDRPRGRKKILTPPPTKELLLARKFPTDILQPEAIDEGFISKIHGYRPDFFVVTAYSKILPGAILEVPARGALGIHPSLLPKYRGTTPIQSAILGGEKETGVTIYLLDPKVDHGLTLASEKCEIGEYDTYTTLSKKLADLGGDLLLRILPSFLDGKLPWVEQDEKAVTHTKKFFTEDAFIPGGDLKEALAVGGEKAIAIWRKIRALNPEPGVWTTELAPYAPKRAKLLEAEISEGKLVLTTIQVEGEKPKRVIANNANSVK